MEPREVGEAVKNLVAPQWGFAIAVLRRWRTYRDPPVTRTLRPFKA